MEKGLLHLLAISKYAVRGGLSGSEGWSADMYNNRNLRGILLGVVFLVAGAGAASSQEVSSSRKVLKSVAAQYPSVLKRRGIGGTVKLRVLVNPGGTVKEIQVLGGNPILSDSAAKAIKQWVFAPADKEESVEISVGFDPNQAD